MLLFIDNLIVCIEIPKESAKKLLGLFIEKG